ncbi:MAG: hypothetical protein KVP17_002062 [Porospora cf. gigantea B]|nr:MAG: hypothetical protein KVP17_002062 [Porospora cf. gigantea B]
MVSVWGVFDFLFYVFCYPSDWKLGVTMMAVYGLFALTFYITYLVRRHMFGSRHILRDIYALMEE